MLWWGVACCGGVMNDDVEKFIEMECAGRGGVGVVGGKECAR